MVTLSGQRGGQPRISYGQLMSSLEVALIEPVRNIDLYGCVEQLASLAMRIRRSEFRWPHVGMPVFRPQRPDNHQGTDPDQQFSDRSRGSAAFTIFQVHLALI